MIANLLIVAVAVVEYVAVLAAICGLLRWHEAANPQNNRITVRDVAITALWPVMVPALVGQLAWERRRARRAAAKQKGVTR